MKLVGGVGRVAGIKVVEGVGRVRESRGGRSSGGESGVWIERTRKTEVYVQQSGYVTFVLLLHISRRALAKHVPGRCEEVVEALCSKVLFLSFLSSKNKNQV